MKFKLNYCYLQGAGFKAMDWVPGQQQPIEKCSKSAEIEADDEEEAVTKLAERHDRKTISRTEGSTYGDMWIESVEIIS